MQLARDAQQPFTGSVIETHENKGDFKEW